MRSLNLLREQRANYPPVSASLLTTIDRLELALHNLEYILSGYSPTAETGPLSSGRKTKTICVLKMRMRHFRIPQSISISY